MGTKLSNPWETQVGGKHYKKYAIQPTYFLLKNNIPFVEGAIIDYIVRWRDKNGIQDLEKAKHMIDFLIYENTKK
jgi:hypothetical protein